MMRAIPKWVEKIHEQSDKTDVARYKKKLIILEAIFLTSAF